MEEKIRVKLTVKGFVQGVGYRFFAVKQANNLGVKGYVKNLITGDVEAVAEGKKETIEKFIENLKRGPSFSKVENIEIDWENYEGEFKGFDIRF